MNLYNSHFMANYYDGKITRTEEGFSWELKNHNIRLSASENVEGNSFKTEEQARKDLYQFARKQYINFGDG